MIEDWRAREAALFKSLAGWDVDRAVVIGGYAVSAWSVSRYSVDIDFVVPHEALSEARTYLESQEFRLHRQRTELEQNYGGRWEQWRTEEGVTIDLLAGSVQDRHFQIPMPHEEVWRGHDRLPIRGLEESGLELPAASKEVLIALKVQPGRPRDLGDLACLAYTGYDRERVRRLVAPLAEAKPTLYQQRVQALRELVEGSETSVQRALGPRIPGLARIRSAVVGSVRRLARDLDDGVGGGG